MAVSLEKLRWNDWKELILWALKTIADRVISVDDSTGDEPMDDATGDGDEAMTGDTANCATIDVDKVLDKILDHTIEAYGSSARDVYNAIVFPTSADGLINDAVANLEYTTLREVIKRVEQIEPADKFPHTIFSMRETESPGRAHLRNTRGLEVVFKSHSIKSKVLKKLDFLHHLNASVMIEELKSLHPSSSYAGF